MARNIVDTANKTVSIPARKFNPRWLLIGLILAFVIGVGGYYAFNKATPTATIQKPPVQANPSVETDIWSQLDSEWPEVEKEIRPLVETTDWYKDGLSFSEKVFIQGLYRARWNSVWDEAIDYPMMKEVILGRKFIEGEITIRSGKKIPVLAFSPNISLAESAVRYTKEIIPALESLFDQAYPFNYVSSNHIVVIYVKWDAVNDVPGPNGRASGTMLSDNTLDCVDIVANKDGGISLYTFIHEFAHFYGPMPYWLLEGVPNYASFEASPQVARKLGIELGASAEPDGVLVKMADTLGNAYVAQFLKAVIASYGPIATNSQHPERQQWATEDLANEKLIQIAKQCAPTESKEKVETLMRSLLLVK